MCVYIYIYMFFCLLLVFLILLGEDFLRRLKQLSDPKIFYPRIFYYPCPSTGFVLIFCFFGGGFRRVFCTLLLCFSLTVQSICRADLLTKIIEKLRKQKSIKKLINVERPRIDFFFPVFFVSFPSLF